MKTWNLRFTTEDNWQPLENACWVNCPVSILTPLGDECRAKYLHDRKIATICPIYHKAILENNFNNKENENG